MWKKSCSKSYLLAVLSSLFWVGPVFSKLVLLDIELDYKNESLKLREEINVVTGFLNGEVKKIYGKKDKIYLIISPKILPETNNIEINGELILTEDIPVPPTTPASNLKKKQEATPPPPPTVPLPRTISKFQFNGLTGSKSEVRSKNEAEFFVLELRSHLIDAYGIPMKQDVPTFSNRIESIYKPESDASSQTPQSLQQQQDGSSGQNQSSSQNSSQNSASGTP